MWEYERENGCADTPGNKFMSLVYTDITIMKQQC